MSSLSEMEMMKGDVKIHCLVKSSLPVKKSFQAYLLYNFTEMCSN